MGALKIASESAKGAPETAKATDAIFTIARTLLVPALTAAVITAALMRLAYDTSFVKMLAVFLLFFMLAVSLLLGMMISSLISEQQRQQEAEPREAEQEKREGEQKERAYKSSSQNGGGRHTLPVSPQKLRDMPYEEYLQTPHWKRKREDKLRAVGYRCQVCHRGGRTLEVHHRTYDRRGEELDQDLTVLCRACHTTFHRHRRLGR